MRILQTLKFMMSFRFFRLEELKMLSYTSGYGPRHDPRYSIAKQIKYSISGN